MTSETSVWGFLISKKPQNPLQEPEASPTMAVATEARDHLTDRSRTAINWLLMVGCRKKVQTYRRSKMVMGIHGFPMLFTFFGWQIWRIPHFEPHLGIHMQRLATGVGRQWSPCRTDLRNTPRMWNPNPPKKKTYGACGCVPFCQNLGMLCQTPKILSHFAASILSFPWPLYLSKPHDCLHVEEVTPPAEKVGESMGILMGKTWKDQQPGMAFPFGKVVTAYDINTGCGEITAAWKISTTNCVGQKNWNPRLATVDLKIGWST